MDTLGAQYQALEAKGIRARFRQVFDSPFCDEIIVLLEYYYLRDTFYLPELELVAAITSWSSKTWFQ